MSGSQTIQLDPPVRAVSAPWSVPGPAGPGRGTSESRPVGRILPGLVRAAGSRTIAGFAPCRRLAVLLLALARAKLAGCFLAGGFSGSLIAVLDCGMEWSGLLLFDFYAQNRDNNNLSFFFKFSCC